MKRILLLVITGLLLFACAKQQKNAMISGKIHAQVQSQPEHYYIGLYPLNPLNRHLIGQPIVFFSSPVPAFEIQAEPGMYMLIVYSLETETMKDYLLVGDRTDHIFLQIQLPPRGVDEVIEEVGVIGSFCDWDPQRAASLQEENGKWRMEGLDPLQLGDRYNFVVNGVVVFDVSENQVEPVQEGAGLNNIYSGAPLIFDPGLYQQPRLQPVIAVSGFDLHDAFHSLLVDLETFDRHTMRLMGKPGMSRSEYTRNYRTLLDTLDRYQAIYPASLQQAFLEKRLDYIIANHPVGFEFGLLKRYARPDSNLLKSVYYGRRFRDFFTSILDQMRHLDPTSPLLTGRWASNVMYYGHYPAADQVLQERFDLYEEFFYDYLLDFVERSPHRKLCAELLYSGGYAFAENRKVKEARHFIRLLKKKYAHPFYVESGLADRVLAGLEVMPGRAAPDFTVTLLSGEQRTLSDLKGRFVLLDFWGSWCAPCIREIPNLIALDSAIAADSLHVLGIANDDPEQIQKFIKIQSIPYSNAMVTEELELQYGITAYPTSFLIDPDGLICGKNLRGPDLIMLVREKINAYYASQ